MVNPEWLRYFQVVAETRSLAAASKQLHVTPQALSHALQGLEDHYRQTLLDRGHRVRGLTPAGEALLQEIPRILDSLESAERRLAEIRSGEPEGEVSLGSVSYINHYYLPDKLAGLVQRYPKIVPRLQALRAPEAERAVAMGEIDIAILTSPPTRSGLRWHEGPRNPYLIVGRPGPERPWDELGYIVPVFHEAERDVSSCASEQALDGPWGGFKRRVVARIDLLETSLSLCEAGIGAAFLPECAVRQRLDKGTLAVVARAPVEYSEELFIAWREASHLPAAVSATLRAIGVR